LQYSVANLFSIIGANFYQNWPSFVEDVTKKLAYFFLGYVVYSVDPQQVWYTLN